MSKTTKNDKNNSMNKELLKKINIVKNITNKHKMKNDNFNQGISKIRNLKFKIDFIFNIYKLLKNKNITYSIEQMSQTKTPQKYFNTAKTPRAVPIYLVGKNPAKDSGAFQGVKNATIDNIWKEENRELNDKRIKTYLTETGQKCNHLAQDTNKYPVGDLDFKGTLEEIKKHKILYKIWKYCDKTFPKYKSISNEAGNKPMGFHYILPPPTDKTLNYNNDKDCITDRTKCLPELFMDKKDKTCVIELLTGKWAWIGKDTEIIMPEKMPTAKDTKKLFQMIIKPEYHYGYVPPVPIVPEPKNEVVEKPQEFILSDNEEEPENEDCKVDLNDNPNKKKNEGDFNYTELTEYINNIHIDYINSDKDFYVLIGACANTIHSDKLKTAIYNAGKKSHKANNGNKPYDNWFEYMWDRAVPRNINVGVIFNYSKNSDKKTHYMIYHKYNNPSEVYDSQEFAEVFLKNNKSAILVQKNKNDPQQAKQIYWFNHKTAMWENATNDKFAVMKNCIGSDMKFHLYNEKMKMKNMIEELNKQLEEEEVGSPNHKKIEGLIQQKIDLYKIINNKYKSTGEPTFRNNVSTILEQELVSLHTEYKDFDNQPYLLTFENGSYDLINNEIKPISREDYITRLLSYELREPCEKNYQEFLTFFNSCMKYDEVKQDLTYILATALAGKTPQKLFMLNGAGRNGKSVLQNIMSKMLDCYCCDANGNLLATEVSPSKASPEFGDLHKKRVAFYSEPCEKKCMSQATIKTLTGDGKIQARMLYSNNSETIIEATHILICNKPPDIDGEIGTAIIERLCKIDFPFEFIADGVKYIEGQGNYKTPNKLYENSAWLEEAKYSMLKYLLEFIKSYPDKIGNGKTIWEDNKYQFCERTKTSSGKFCESVDIVRDWLMNNVKLLTEDEIKTFSKTQYLSCIQEGEQYDNLYEKFTGSEAYSKLKQKKKDINKTGFKKTCANTFPTNFVMKNGSWRGLIKNARLRTDTEIMDKQDEDNNITGLVEDTIKEEPETNVNKIYAFSDNEEPEDSDGD